jgi:hypothetical protein
MASPANESKSKDLLGAQLRATLDVVPAYTWHTNPSGALTFVYKRHADYLGLPKDHPLRFGIDVGAEWDSHIREKTDWETDYRMVHSVAQSGAFTS